MKADYKELKKCGYQFENEEAIYNKMVELIEYLSCHNKNYTKTQIYSISELEEIIKSMEVEK